MDGRQHGKWVARFADGTVMKGSVVGDKQHVQWVMRSPDGDVYEFTFVNGEMQ